MTLKFTNAKASRADSGTTALLLQLPMDPDSLKNKPRYVLKPLEAIWQISSLQPDRGFVALS